MAQQIKAYIAAENGVVFLDDPDQELIPRIISCININPQVIVWLQPIVYDGVVSGYEPIIGGNKPSDDSLKTIKVEDYNNHNVYYVAVDDAFTVDDFATKCNECCGTTPEITAPTVPVPIVDVNPCPTIPAGTPQYTFLFPFPENDNALNYTLQASFNGAYATPVPDVNGYADEAAVLTFAQAASPSGWANYGTWSLVTPATGPKLLKLVSTTTKSANVVIGLLAESYCMDIPTPDATIDSIVINGETTTFPAVTLSRTAPEAAFYAIRPYLIGDLQIVSSGGHNKLQYTGLQVPQTLKNGASTVATFNAGVCP